MSERLIGRLLWTVSTADAAAAPGMRDLSHAPLLTWRERELAAVLAREETCHAAVAARWADRLGCPKGHVTPYGALARRDAMTYRRVGDPVLRLAWLLGALQWHEVQSVRGFPRWTALFRRLGYSELANDFAELTEQERGHVAFGRSVAERLDVLPGFTAAYRHHYRLTAQIGAGVLAATFSPTLTRLEAAVR